MINITRMGDAGSIIGLRCKFIDDQNDSQQASGVSVSIFPPNVTDFTNFSTALVTSGTPTFIGNGIYEYDFSIPNNAASGVWTDYWQGQLPYQAVSGCLGFIVNAHGSVSGITGQLFENNVVEVTIASGVRGIDGSTFNEYSFDFMTTTNPTYTEIRKLRLEVGAFVQDIEDDDLQTAILEASLYSQVMVFAHSTPNSPLFIHARREYTTCLAARILLDNLSRGFTLRGKSLGDLSVQYDPRLMIRLMDKLDNCVGRWEGEVIAGGGMRLAEMPRYCVPGELDPDRPNIGRLWTETGGAFTRRVPAANTRQILAGHRRSQTAYKSFLTTPGWRRGW